MIRNSKTNSVFVCPYFYLPILQRIPIYPGKQLHTYPLTRFEQEPFTQGELEHSSISLKENRYFITWTYVKETMKYSSKHVFHFGVDTA